MYSGCSAVGLVPEVISVNWADFGVIPNNSTAPVSSANGVAITAWRAFARKQSVPIILTINPGTYYADNNTDGQDSVATPWSLIFVPLRVVAYGAVITWNLNMSGRAGFPLSEVLSARIQQVNIGDTSATLINQSDIYIASAYPAYIPTNFRVGQWCSIDCFELQGNAGYPPNHHNQQYVKITRLDVNNGIIYFDGQPSLYKLETTCPVTTDLVGHPGYDTGGPATIHMMTYGWDQDLTFEGITIAPTTSDQTYGNCRSLKLIDCHFVGTAIIPTENMTFFALRCTTDSFQIEVDKECTDVYFQDCNLQSMTCQSSSIQNLRLHNVTFNSFFNGSPRNLILDVCNMTNIRLGVEGYGQAETAVINNTVCSGVVDAPMESSGQIDSNNVTFLGSGRLLFTGSGVSSWVSQGPTLWVLSYFNTDTGVGSSYVFSFTVSDFVSDIPSGGRTALLTNLPNTLPPTPIDPTAHGVYLFRSHPMRSVTCTGLTGSLSAADFNGMTPGAPANTHVMGTFTGLPAENRDEGSAGPALWGKLISMTVNVITAYTGVHLDGALVIRALVILDSTPSVRTTLRWSFDARTAGLRTLTPASYTGTQSTDLDSTSGSPVTITNIGPFTFTDNIDVVINYDLSGESPSVRPLVKFEVFTDQSPRY